MYKSLLYNLRITTQYKKILKNHIFYQEHIIILHKANISVQMDKILYI